MRRRTLALLPAAALAATVLAGTPAAAAGSGAGSGAGSQSLPAFVFVSDRDGDNEIYLRRADGRVRQLTRNRIDDFSPAWSPDGRLVAFVRGSSAGTALFVMRPDGAGVRRITTPVRTPDGVPSRDRAPAWSPDGRTLAFASDRRGGEGDVWRVDLDGGDLRPLTRTAPFIGDGNPTWSPDGRWIWFDSSRFGDFNRELMRMRPDGTAVQRMTRTPDDVDDGAPEFSPDGRRVAFISLRANGSQDLYTMRPDGTGVRPLGEPTAGLDEVFPRWTPDGRTVLHWRFGTETDPTERIWAIDADGTDRRLVRVGPGNNSSPDPYPVPAR